MTATEVVSRIQEAQRELENLRRNIAEDAAWHPLVTLRLRDPSLETPEVRQWLDTTARQMETECAQALWRVINPPIRLEEFDWPRDHQFRMGRLFFMEQSPPMEVSRLQSPDTWDDLPMGCSPSIEDPPDDTALPLDEWTAKVDAFIAEWEAQQDG